MKKFFLLAALVCFAALNVNAQTEEQETKGHKFFRLTKTADDNPTDWKAQLEAGHFLLDKENGMYNLTQAEKYYERLYHLATDYNKEIPDSVFRETGMMLMMVAGNDKKDLDKALFYIDGMTHAQKVGVDIGHDYLISIASWGMMYSMVKEDFSKSMSYMMMLRELVTKNNTPGIEHTDVFTAILFERLMEKYKNMFGDKVMELIFDGKKYYLVSMGEWNIEKPLMGWMQTEEGSTPLLYGEDGKIHDDIHGNMEYSFQYYKDGIKPKEGANAQLVTLTPEVRQQMVEAYRNYIKKAKKDKK